jgi:DNA-binding IclR family transcriptional regulator
LRLAFRNLSARPDTLRIQPLLEELATALGETAHYAILSGREIVYRAKMDPPQGAVRLTSVVGGRNPAYRTAVGKALLSSQVTSVADVIARVGSGPYEAKTAQTITSPAALFVELERTRARGYGIDDQENEVGVNCLAIPVFLDGADEPTGAISISAVRFRCPLDRLIQSVPELRETVARHLGANALG